MTRSATAGAWARPVLWRTRVGPVHLGRGGRMALMAAFGLFGLLGLAGCSEPSNTLDPAVSERAVDKVIGGRIGPPVAEVRCPKEITKGTGKRFSCRAVLEDDAGSVRLRVRQVDADGRLRVDLLDAVLDADDVAGDVTRALVRTYRRQFTVDCGEEGPRVVAPDTTFTCDAEDSAGRRQVVVTVVDAAGTLRYDVGD